MYNSFVDGYRKSKNIEVVQLESKIPYNIEGNNKDINQKMAVQHIYTKINLLKKRERDPLYLLIKGYQYQEIANKLNKPLGTIKVILFRARKQLKEAL